MLKSKLVAVRKSEIKTTEKLKDIENILDELAEKKEKGNAQKAEEEMKKDEVNAAAEQGEKNWKAKSKEAEEQNRHPE